MNRRFKLTGIIQGVGFRPHVYQLASRYGVSGYVQNSGSGVTVEVEGESMAVEQFEGALRSELPPLARIDSLLVETGECVGYATFEIVNSTLQNEKRALVSPDIALCDNCLAEMHDASNRRYGYPLINCTDCGPRYSIIETLPYDRPNTSMAAFSMCPACEAEYTNPLDRRYHAQPISCPECGPAVTLLDQQGEVLARGDETVALAAGALMKGMTVAVKGMGGFHLLCDATNDAAVEQLRKRKRRPAKPFAVMFPDMASIEAAAHLSASETALIASRERPIVVVRKREGSPVVQSVAPGIDRIGVFLSYTPLHHLLLAKTGRPVVATSANLSDEPIIRERGELLQKLGDTIDRVLDHEREIINANDDGVVQMADGQKITLRLARGSAPVSYKLPFTSKKRILAVGANQKNSIALVFGDTLILSPHIGDLNSIEALEYFERTVETFMRFYDFEPELIVCDKHPGYETTKWAMAQNQPTLHLQHHYAHLLAGMAEFRLQERVLGFAFDGTGYGDDGTIWGGEVMLADSQEYERLFSLEPFRLLGGEKAVREPRRSALALLFEHYTLEECKAFGLPLLETFGDDELALLHRAWKEGINAPTSSSFGRLFDAVAALTDIVQVSSYEGESGLMMEQYADPGIEGHFPFGLDGGLITLGPMIDAMLRLDERRQIISLFFNTVVEMIFQIAARYPDLPLLFSGGVFQSRVLVEMINRRSHSRICYFQRDTPINDGGIALGQAWFAASMHAVSENHPD